MRWFRKSRFGEGVKTVSAADNIDVRFTQRPPTNRTESPSMPSLLRIASGPTLRDFHTGAEEIDTAHLVRALKESQQETPACASILRAQEHLRQARTALDKLQVVLDRVNRPYLSDAQRYSEANRPYVVDLHPDILGAM